jgi:hypothetical protein
VAHGADAEPAQLRDVVFVEPEERERLAVRQGEHVLRAGTKFGIDWDFSR